MIGKVDIDYSSLLSQNYGEKINELVDAVNEPQATISKMEKVAENGNCAKCGHAKMFGSEELWQELIHTRKENEDKQAVLNCVVDMLKTLNQKYTLIMGKDVIKETVRLLEQTKGGDNEK